MVTGDINFIVKILEADDLVINLLGTTSGGPDDKPMDILYRLPIRACLAGGGGNGGKSVSGLLAFCWMGGSCMVFLHRGAYVRKLYT